jgi:hypothetical protein
MPMTCTICWSRMKANPCWTSKADGEAPIGDLPVGLAIEPAGEIALRRV